MNKNTEIFENYDDIVSVEEVMEMLRLGRVTIYNLLKKGEIKSLKVGRKYIIPKQCVIDFVMK